MVLYYVQVNLICLISLCGIYFMSKKVQTELSSRRAAFEKLLLWTAVLCISDMTAGILRGKTFEGAGSLINLSNMIYLLSLTWTSYAWFVYSNIRIKGTAFELNKYRLASAIPLAVMAALIFTNPLTGWLFIIDENNLYSRQSLIFLHWIISLGYMIIATIQIFIAIKKAETKARKKELYPLLYFLVLPAIAAVAQMMFYGVTSTQCGIVLSIAMVFFNSMNDKVLKDALTGLNNRGALNGFLSDQFNRNEQYVYVFMMDLDGFKNINDTYGHSEGDKALKKAAGILKEICGSSTSNLFLCRYGGDEFLIIGRNMSDVEADGLVKLIEKSGEGTESRSGDLKVNFSIGVASGICSNITEVEKLLIKADGNMYNSKLNKKA